MPRITGLGGYGAALVVLGVVVGVPGIYLAGQALRATLVGISPFDPVTLAVVGAALVAAGVTSCYLPARRVVGIDPARAFREG